MTEPLSYAVEGHVFRAASVAGFRPRKSTLNVKEQIAAALPDISRMVLAFGQVDLELGYYYRIAVKGEAVTPETYPDWLISIYRDFLRGLTSKDCQLALKGVNLTTLAPVEFSARYVAKIVNEGGKLPRLTAVEKVRSYILPEAEQNRMHLAFNDRLRDLASEIGARYFDLNDALAEPAGERKLADRFKPGTFDHHLADTVEVRQLHYRAIGKAFDI
ncbi:hypothetical protein [Paracoccus ravus]|uniref:hypothetical protein n=1 Tax=Paracoccus ravus TaxID=2447760 RepID=UPI00106E2FE1|nr:hypothetical protein [Paracoccus ravus]